MDSVVLGMELTKDLQFVGAETGESAIAAQELRELGGPAGEGPDVLLLGRVIVESLSRCCCK